jgi:glucan phosphorylase
VVCSITIDERAKQNPDVCWQTSSTSTKKGRQWKWKTLRGALIIDPDPKVPAELPAIVYFSMEVGLEPAMPTYAGGLGVLAGDTLRAAAGPDGHRWRCLADRWCLILG